MPHRAALLSGSLYALAAGLMWGLVFVVPVLLPAYPAALLSVARYLAFGLIALPLAWFDRARIAGLSRADWREATRLALVGNLLYYLFLAAAIQRAGVPVPTMIIGTLPVVIAVASNLRRARPGSEPRMPWRRLAPSLLLIGAGIVLVNRAEFRHQALEVGVDAGRYAGGALLAVGAVACWTWYPIRNADWLRRNPTRSPTTWATAQGLATLPLAAVGGGLLALAGIGPTAQSPLGPTPVLFLTLIGATGLFASWLGTLCWNAASQRLPTTLSGQLIVFETLAALGYGFVLRGRAPEPATLAGIALLVVGVAWALRKPASRRL